MSYMMLHFLDAQKTLTAHSDWIKNCLTATHRRADSLMSLPALDVVVKTGNRVVPEKGHSGFCPEPGIVYVTVDPDNPALCQNAAQSLERMFAHELHHAARWAGPGYGTILGEACVSEGLAGHFVLELFGGEPELWECINAELIHAYLPQLHQDWLCTDYDHSKWFYGAGDMPRWLGYTLGLIWWPAILLPGRNVGLRSWPIQKPMRSASLFSITPTYVLVCVLPLRGRGHNEPVFIKQTPLSG